MSRAVIAGPSRRAFLTGSVAAAATMALAGGVREFGEPAWPGAFYPYRMLGEMHADFLRRALRSTRAVEIVGTPS